MDARLIEQAYEQHALALWRFLARRVEPDVADDLLMQVFESALRTRNEWDDRGFPVSAWLYTIAHSRVVDHIRAERSRARFVSIDDCMPASDGGIEQAIERVAAQPIFAALDRLAPNYRLILHLRFLEDRSLSEVAAHLRISVNAAKALQHRALIALRQAVG